MRQIALRARRGVAERRPRFDVPAAEQLAVVDRFREAVDTGDLDALLALLAPDVVLVPDGGGKVAAAPRELVGAVVVGRFLSRLRALAAGASLTPMVLNGAPGIGVVMGGRLDTAVGVEVRDGLVARVYAVRNPDKLVHAAAATTLAR